jgi:hypothetical protein
VQTMRMRSPNPRNLPSAPPPATPGLACLRALGRRLSRLALHRTNREPNAALVRERLQPGRIGG